jgi:parallel beta-helix repeat protein
MESGNCILVSSSQHVVIEAVTCQNAWNDGIYVCSQAGSETSDVVVTGCTLNGNRRNGCSVVWANGFILRNSIIENSTGSIETQGGALVNGSGIDIEPNTGQSCDNIVIVHDSFTGNASNGIAYGIGDASTTHVFVDHNTISGSGYHGIDAEDVDGSAITGNTVTGAAQVGIYVHSAATGTLVQGNTVTGTTGSQSAGSGNGIQCYQDSGTRILSNVLDDNQVYGIYVIDSTSPTVENNVCTGNGSAGVYLVNATGATTSGNTP